MTLDAPMTAITPQPGIMDIDLYVGGESAVVGVSDVLKLSSNENPRGPSPRAIEAFQSIALAMGRYPSSDHAGLRTAIGDVFDLDPGRVICGAGSDELIAFLCQCYAGPGDEVIYTEHGFAMYRISALAAGATPICVAEKDRVTDIEAVLAAVTPATRLVFLANPNNPTGTFVGGDVLADLASRLPDYVVLVLDGAYAEFVDGYDGGASIVDAHPNVVMTRTFSKIYGLGSLRVGWAYAHHEVIDVLNRVRGPFNVNGGALAAAEAAVRDAEYQRLCKVENAEVREELTQFLRSIGVQCDDSFANFVLARFASEATAGTVEAGLKAKGIIVRKVGSYGLPQALRITVPDRDNLDRLKTALSEIVGEAKQ
jgi:histidinol-phosphate aminotransferase